MKLADDIKKLQKTEIKDLIDKRLDEFSSQNKNNPDAWFSELCFCILTANSKAETAIAIQKELGAEGFLNSRCGGLSCCIRKNKHRFHNNKARYIIDARKHLNIKSEIKKIVDSRGEKSAREWLADNVKGIGFKEASHFMRNVGYKNLAILDRHILRLMLENRLISEIPKPLTRKKYLEIEREFEKLASKFRMSCAELDLYMWYLKTGKVLK